MYLEEGEVKQGGQVVYKGERLVLLESSGDPTSRIELEEEVDRDFVVNGEIRIPAELRSNPYVYYEQRWKVFISDDTPFDYISGFVTHRKLVYRSNTKFRELYFPEDNLDRKTDLNEEDLQFF